MEATFERIFARINRFMARNLFFIYLAVVAVALLVGYGLHPNPRVLKSLILPLLFVMVYPMMIRIRAERLGDAFRRPKFMVGHWIFQFGIAPALIFGLAILIIPSIPSPDVPGGDLKPWLVAGAVLVGVVPACGMTPGWTGLGNGNIALAVILLATGMVLDIAAAPLLSLGYLPKAVPWAPGYMLRALAIIVIIPLIAGYLTRTGVLKYGGQERYNRVELVLPLLTVIGLMGVIFCAMAAMSGFIFKYPGLVGRVVLIWVAYYCIITFILFLVMPYFATNYGDAVAFFYGGYLKNFSLTLGFCALVFPGMMLIMLPVVAAMFVQTPGGTLVLRGIESVVRFKAAPVT